jgi:hypothetical protein
MTNIINKRADFDSPWKEILTAYFPQAMQFFFPETYALINWERPYEFLDKEFQQITREAEQGKRYADQLVKVWQIQGEQLWLLVHVEIQGKKEDNFGQRIFTYLPTIIAFLTVLVNPQPVWRFYVTPTVNGDRVITVTIIPRQS